MSLLDKINSNTEKVRAGKSGLVTAIKSKGGSISAAGSVPTFNELINGVNSIDTSSGGGGGSGDIIVETKVVYSAGNGAKDMTAMAIEGISANDSIKVVKNTGGDVSYVGSSILPTTAKEVTTSSSGNPVTYTYPLDVSRSTQVAGVFLSTYRSSSDPHGMYNSASNKFICVGAQAPIDYYFPFFLKDGVYQQLKINGSYRDIPNYVSSSGNLNGHFQSGGDYYQSKVAYDEDRKLFYAVGSVAGGISHMVVYKLDEENLNLTVLICKERVSYIPLFALNGHLIVSSSYYVNIYKFNETTNTMSGSVIYKGSTYNYTAYGIKQLRNKDLYVIVGLQSRAGTSSLAKLTYLEETDTYSVTITATGVSLPTVSCVGMPDATRIFYVDKYNGTFGCKRITDNGTSWGYADEDITTLFADDITVFDPSTITKFVVDNSGYMIAETSDGTYYLLKTNFDIDGNIIGYHVVAKPKEDFTPNVTTFPTGYAPNIDFANGYFMFDADNNKLLYQQVVNGGEYLIQKTNNQFSAEDNLYGYGVAKSDIPTGEEGTVSLGLWK